MFKKLIVWLECVFGGKKQNLLHMSLPSYLKTLPYQDLAVIYLHLKRSDKGSYSHSRDALAELIFKAMTEEEIIKYIRLYYLAKPIYLVTREGHPLLMTKYGRYLQANIEHATVGKPISGAFDANIEGALCLPRGELLDMAERLRFTVIDLTEGR